MISITAYELKESDYAVQASMIWKDLDAWNAAQNGDDNVKVMGDIPNFTNVTPVLLVGSLKG